jgi:hypothetical protein
MSSHNPHSRVWDESFRAVLRILDLEAVTSFSANGLLLKQAWRCAAQDKQEISGGSI